jgi:outer membrane protein W
MKTSLLTLLTLLSTLLAAGCSTLNQPLASEPYEEFGEGTITLGGSTGWAFYGADAEAVGKSGVLTGETGTDSTTLTPNYGGALKLGYMVTDHVQLGGIVELRSFEPDPLSPLSATLSAGDFETWHFILSSRYFFDPMGDDRRWRPFAGIDLSYIPDVPLGSVKVDYPDSTGFPDEYKNVTGSDYWAIGAVAGMNYLLTDHLTLDMGAFYEYAINTSGATVAFDNLGGAEAEMALRPQGLIVFFGLSYAF